MFKKHISLFLLNQYTSELECLLGSILLITGVLSPWWLCPSSVLDHHQNLGEVLPVISNQTTFVVAQMPTAVLYMQTSDPWLCYFGVTFRAGASCVWIPHPRHFTFLDISSSGHCCSAFWNPFHLGDDFPSLPGLRKSPFLWLPLQGPPLSLLLPGHPV